MSDQNNQQKGFFGTAASGLGMFHSKFFASILWPFFSFPPAPPYLVTSENKLTVQETR
jgi:hypothetical protein